MNMWEVFAKGFFAILVVIIVFWLVHLTTAHAHSWYDWECCSGEDCNVVDHVDHGDGYNIYHSKMFGGVKITHEEMKIREKDGRPFKIKQSKDSNMHICAYKYNIFLDEDGKRQHTPAAKMNLRCLYIPGTS